MTYKLTVDLPNLGDGGGLVIDGLGEFKAGDNELTDEQVVNFERQHVRMEPQYAYDEYDEDGKPVGDGTVVGKSQVAIPITEILRGVEGVTVEKVGDTPDSDSDSSVVTPSDPSGVSESTDPVDNNGELQLDLGGTE